MYNTQIIPYSSRQHTAEITESCYNHLTFICDHYILLQHFISKSAHKHTDTLVNEPATEMVPQIAEDTSLYKQTMLHYWINSFGLNTTK